MDVLPYPPRVIIVEDDVSLLSALTFALEAEGFVVSPFDRGQDLLDRPVLADCLVVDLRLRDADGLSLIKELRMRGVAAPAILITTNPDEKCRRRAAEAAVEIVEKPLIGTDLGRQIAAAIGRR